MTEYRIDSSDIYLNGKKYPTLAAARKALRANNGGRLYGRFKIPDYEAAVEGWNLAKHENCDTAAIVRITR